MDQRHLHRAVFFFVALFAACVACAQVPPEIADRLRGIGAVINPAETAALYAPRVSERVPAFGVTVSRDQAYGPAARHRLDVFAAEQAGGRRPVLVFVHGGAFVAGNRRTGSDSPFYDNIALWAVREGMVGVTMTYRLAPQDPWPAGAQDVGRAVGWLREHAAAFGGDPDRIHVLGHSAGATHVAAYVAHPAFHAAPGGGIAGALLLSGVYEITPSLVAGAPTYPSYFGSDPARHAEQSSLDGLLGSGVPLWVGSAELDPPQFRAQAALLRERLRKAGRPFGGADFAGHSHMSTVYSVLTDDRSVMDAMRAFVRAARP